MLSNFIRISLRGLWRNKFFTFINVFGLSMGLACCMLLLLYVRSEMAYDAHHQHAGDLYLLGTKTKIGTAQQDASAHASAPFAFALTSEYPEIAQAGRLWVNLIDEKALLQVREAGKTVRSFYESKGYGVDSTFFDLFTYQFIEGSPASALRNPGSVVLSGEVARKLFGTAPALDRIVRISGTTGNGENFRVTGVYRDEAGRSHINARFFVPLSAGWVGSFLRGGRLDFASNNMFYTYLRLRPGTDPGQLTRKLPAFLQKYARADLRASGFEKTLFLVNVPDLHLYDAFKSVITPTSSRTYLYVLLSVAVFTLLIACINFMNLSTAQSAKRATEVGIRKVLGAEQNALIGQFLAQSVILTLVALLVAGAAVVLLMPAFNGWTGKVLSAASLLDGRMVLTFLGLALFTGLLAGSYPAFYLSMFQPVHVLKGKFTNSLSAVTLRKALVVFQFVVSVGLVLAAFVIGEQMRFMKNQPLGFRQDQQVVIPFRNTEARDAYAAYRSEILRHKGVESAAGTMYYPGIVNPSDFSLYRAGQSVNQGALVKTNWVDYEYLQTLGVQPVQGRLFSRQFPADTNNRLVVNEATLRKFNIPAAQAVGQQLKMDWQGETYPYEIVGVVRDFHFESLHRAIQPYCFLLSSRPSFNYMVVRVNTADVGPVLAALEREWKALRPDDPFAYSFLDADFQQNYQAEVRTARIVRAFTLLSILISCLGLFGLAAFAAQQRTKEIGIRKVLGAGVGSIILLLSKDFLKLVGIAIVVALPLGGWLMGRWLENFAYRIDVSWGLCALAGGLAVAVAFLTISLQSIRAASADPVKSLKSE